MDSFRSIILVDDDPVNNLINRRLISKMGFSNKVEEYLVAEQAVERLMNLNPKEKCLIFLDINMPVMNGWDFLNHYIKAFQDRDDDIIVLSSSIEFQDRQRAKEFPAVVGFIEKPLTPEKIKNVMT